MTEISSHETIDLYVCISCQQDGVRTGEKLAALLEPKLDQVSARVRLHKVECLSVCKRPTTVSVSSPSKWTYIIGDMNGEQKAEELLAYLATYAASPHGTPPLKERPASIRAGTIARIPPRIKETA